MNIIKACAQHQMLEPKIASMFGMSQDTWRRLKKNNPAVQQILDEGRAYGEAIVHQTAFEMATSGKSPFFTKFWLQVHSGWTDRQRIDLNVNVSGAVKLDEMKPEERTERLNKLLELREKLQAPRDVTPQKEQTIEANDDRGEGDT